MRRLVTYDGEAFSLQEFTLPEPGPHDVRVQVTFAAPKHGTEGHLLTGCVLDRKEFDPQLRMFLPRERNEAASAAPQERVVGNMVVGTVTAVGDAVTRWRPGDRVFGSGRIQEMAQAPEDRWYALGTLSDADAVCVDPLHVALVAIRDGQVRLGDTVAVYGLGAIGLMAVQAARASGARQVFGVDPSPLRRSCAEQLGAHATFDPNVCDVALEIKRATGGAGVDVALEVSSNSRALHEAIRCLRQCGTVVLVAWGPHDCSHLHLDEEFHLNRPTLIGSQAWAGWGNPDRDHPRWTPERAYATAIDLLRDGVATGDPVVTPVIAFEEAPAVIGALMRDAGAAIKVGVRFH
ncbi:MAG: zinc-binding alcohol dehydrogenase [Chloroherpetonaceae bacterium]|nr:zinc-binding alcohol dehydrogenase [Chthonomonadaceae bacterium]MDW8206761.1 zinc-binding alcohol dehydrogenase [Chloroherpetonaceae bacterium]